MLTTSPLEAKGYNRAQNFGAHYSAFSWKKKLLLDAWQRVVLIGLDGPREREPAMSISTEH